MRIFYFSSSTVMFIKRNNYVFWAFSIFLGFFICYHSLRMMWTWKILNKQKTLITKKTPIKNFRINETQDFLINTPGCCIPNYAKTFKYIRPVVKSSDYHQCRGQRAVFIDTLDNNIIKFRVYKEKMASYKYCCYKFVSPSIIPGHESDQLSYTSCKVFENGAEVELEQEIITVTCYYYSEDMKEITYRDAYIILKKLNVEDLQSKANKHTWNTLMIGLNAMSRTRVFDTMPLTARYLREYKWLDYKGYQKVDDSTFNFPNLMSVLTGKKGSTINSKCTSSAFKCSDYFIWKKYQDAGYRTAYGEDYLRLPDTYSKYNWFKRKPTDHYMRPLYLTGEKRFKQIPCTGRKLSATHLLEYALNFAGSYKTNKFFGTFWINSYTHIFNNRILLFDAEIVKFFEKLNNSGVFHNTFVIFFSDHGTRFGKMRLPIESFFDERLPMLFMWIPLEFRTQYPDEYYNLKLNQGRLITPYDLYITLADILKISMGSGNVTQSEACPRCTSLFEKMSPNKTCADVGVSENSCSCHMMSNDHTDTAAVHSSLMLAVAHIQNISMSTKTTKHSKCKLLKFPFIVRSHVYHKDNEIYHVIAFHMSPKHTTFEAIVVKNGVDGNFKLMSVRSISNYNTKGNCVLNPNDRPYCLCDVMSLENGKEAELLSEGLNLV